MNKQSALRFFTVAVALCYTAVSAHAQWTGATIDTITRDSFRDEIDKQSLAIGPVNTLHAVWKRAHTGGGSRIFHSSKPPSGTWSTPQEVGDSSIASFNPAIAIKHAGAVISSKYIVFSASHPSSEEIIIAQDSAGGWTRDRLTNNATQDVSPTIAIDQQGRIHLAWIGQDTAANWKIMYATNLGGPWQTQFLAGSELGPFGSGAESFIAVTPSGVAHIFYRGGDFGLYHIHHAWNTSPGGTTWNYEILSTPNGNDFSACAVITQDTTIHLLASGNDGFGFPPRAYYLKKPIGGSWTTPERANPSGSGWGGSLLIDQFGKAHITWDEVSGNFYIGNLHYGTNRTGTWQNTPILADGKTYNGVLVLDSEGKGHALAFNGETFSTQEIFAIHSPGPLTSVDEALASHAAEFKLFQNYPNPFNPSTVISFQLPVSSFITLKVYNVLGQEVTTLVNEELKPGSYKVTFDAPGLSSGVYFYRLAAGGFSQTRKLILMR